MNILENNPYRILGVYSNSPTKERLANHNRMKAFLKVGKPVSFPLDLPQYFSKINRNEAIVSDAEAKLTLPKDQILYSQFWFIKITPLDEVAFNYLISGKIDIAEDIWKKKECTSSLQNLIVCSLMCNHYDNAIAYAEKLYGNEQNINQLVTAVTEISGTIDSTGLAFSFLDTLCDEIGANKLVQFVTNPLWKNHIEEKTVKPLIDSISEAIEIAEKSKGKGPKARFDAGTTLMKDTKKAIYQLKRLLSSDDIQYEVIADKLALEILQCGIDYYNDSDDSDAASKAMDLQSYANSIVVGQMAKKRCKDNVEILQKIIENLPPSEVYAEDKAIHDELRKYCSLPDEICYAVNLLNNTKPYLQKIKRKLGASNSYYLKVSTSVVVNALHNVIEEVNTVQKNSANDINEPYAFLNRFEILRRVRSVLEEAWKATLIMDTFDMEIEFKIGNYVKNRSTLKDLCGQLGIETTTHTPEPSAPKPSSPKPSAPGSSTTTLNNQPSKEQKTKRKKSASKKEKNSSNSDDGLGCFIIALIMVVIGIISRFLE